MPKLTDSIRKMLEVQESFQKLYEPSESIRKMFEQQDSFRKLYEPSESIKKMFEQQDSFRKLYEPSESIKKMFEQQESFRKMCEPTESIRKMFEQQDSLRKLYEPSESIRKIFEKQETFREMFAPSGAVATAFQTLQNQDIFKQLDITDKIKSLADELSSPGFHINSDGSLSLEDQSINISDLSIAVSTFFEEISEDFSTETVLSRLACLQNPAKRIAIWILNHLMVAFFVSVMASIFTPNIQNFLDSNILKSKREVTNTIKKLPPEIDLNDYKGYRVVTAETLNLRQQPSRKSPVISELNRGKLVLVIQKKKNWTKVEIENPNSTGTAVGWVATRYITPLKR